MAKMIKLTDEVGGLLEKRAAEDHLSMAGEVAKLLSGGGDSVSGRLDNLGTYLEKKFDELKALIEDTTVDRVAGRAVPTNHTLVPPEISWPVAQEMFFDVAADEDFVAAGVKKALEDSPNLDEATFYIKDGIIYSMFYGTERPLVKLTPHIEGFLSEKGVL